MGASGSNGGDVIDVTAREADSPSPEPQVDNAQTTSVDPRILGTYDGDGSQKSISNIKPLHGVSSILAVTFFCPFVTFLIMLISEALLHDKVFAGNSKVKMSIIFGTIALIALIGSLMHYRHYLVAILRFDGSDQQATYWMQNQALRNNVRRPHDPDEFGGLLRLAEAADHERAQAYVAEQIEAYYHRLINERKLNMNRIPKGWLAGQILDAGDDYEAEEQ